MGIACNRRIRYSPVHSNQIATGVLESATFWLPHAKTPGRSMSSKPGTPIMVGGNGAHAPAAAEDDLIAKLPSRGRHHISRPRKEVSCTLRESIFEVGDARVNRVLLPIRRDGFTRHGT